MSGMIARRSLTVAVLIVAARVDAHDSWLITERNSRGASGTVRVAFVTSEHFPISEHATRPERVAEWVVIGSEGRQRVTRFAIEDEELVANVPVEGRGPFTIGASLKPQPIELAYDKFERYLREEQAESALRALVAKGAKGAQREHYTKFAKTLVADERDAGDGSAPPSRVGHKLEIHPTSDPSAWSTGREAEVQVLLDGRPAGGLRVSSGREGLGEHAYAQNVVTDSRGMATFKFDRPGLWFVRTHVIRPAEGEAAKDADWESWWASITFRVSERPATAAMLAEVRDIHGAAGPWAVAGYRMGLLALQELGVGRGSFDLEVIHETPMQVQYACIADGIQAATGASAGKLNLKLKEARPEGLRTVFRRKSTGETCVIELTDRARTTIMNVPYERLEATGRQIAEWPDEQLLIVHRAEETCHATTKAAAEPGGSRE